MIGIETQEPASMVRTYTVHVGYDQCYAVETGPIEARSVEEAIEKAIAWCDDGGWELQKSCGDPGDTYIIAISEDADSAWADKDCMSKVPQSRTEEAVICPHWFEFIRQIAGLTKDGEPLDDGKPFDMPSDDAVETLHGLISRAREFLGEPADREGRI